MLVIPILGILVLVVTLIVGIRLRAPILSCYYSFVGFSLLYCSYMFIGSLIETGGLSLLEDLEIIHYVMLSTFMGIFFFVAFYYREATFRIKYYSCIPELKKVWRINKIIFLPFYTVLLIALIIYAKKYGWHAVSRDGVEGIEPSLFAYGKYFFVCMGLLALWCAPLSKRWVGFILITQTVLMMFDGGRTTFFGIVVAYAWILSRRGLTPRISHVIYVLLFGLLLLATRSLVLESGLVNGMLGSLIAEGIFAGYTGLQMADYVRGGGDLLYGLTYLVDPIIYLLPKGIRDEHLFIQLSVGNYIGLERFAPLGGFFWIAEAIANFGFLGGAIVGSLYGYFLAKLECDQRNGGYYSIFVIAAIGCLLSKYNFANGIKIMIFYLGAAFLIRLFFVRDQFISAPVNQPA